MNSPTVIASYPRSGSTYLRFLIANILWSHIDHDLSLVNKHIPTLESKDEILKGINNPPYYKTHSLINSRNIIFLHRHVGDCLVSEFHYHVTYHDFQGNVDEFIEAVNYGENWRNMVDHYFPCMNISFENLTSDPLTVLRDVFYFPHEISEKAIEICTFDNLKLQDKMFFRSGKTGQWEGLSEETSALILERNWRHLKILGYKI